MSTERTKQINEYKGVKSTFTDYTHFEGEKDHRTAEREAFMAGDNYTPAYKYERLDSLNDGDELKNQKTAIYEAVLELEAAKSEPGVDAAELEIYTVYLELRLNRILLVEAAQKVNSAIGAAERATAINSYAALNERVYGTFDADVYLGMLSTEMRRVGEFKPLTAQAARVWTSLRQLLPTRETSLQPEQELLSSEMMEHLQNIIMQRYGHILAVVPETDDSTYYNADDCARIMSDALDAGGLTEKGWRIVIDSKKSNPSTNARKRIISIPSSTTRNAGELRRLIIHEQEVHARRGENGHETGFEPLKAGTADYADVEEGLGVLFECAIAGDWDNPSFDRARDRYITAGLALGVDGAARDARQVNETLWRLLAIRNGVDGDISDEAIIAAQDKAYAHVENAFRSTEFWMRGVIYTKLKVYFEGLRKNAQYISKHVNDIEGAIDMAMIGKYDHTNSFERSNILTVLANRRKN